MYECMFSVLCSIVRCLCERKRLNASTEILCIKDSRRDVCMSKERKRTKVMSVSMHVQGERVFPGLVLFHVQMCIRMILWKRVLTKPLSEG